MIEGKPLNYNDNIPMSSKTSRESNIDGATRSLVAPNDSWKIGLISRLCAQQDMEESASVTATVLEAKKKDTKMWGHFLDSDSSEESQEVDREESFTFRWPASSPGTSPSARPGMAAKSSIQKQPDAERKQQDEAEKENQSKNHQPEPKMVTEFQKPAPAEKPRKAPIIEKKTDRKGPTIFSPFDEASVSKWSIARIKTWKERHSNPNAFYYRFTGTPIRKFD